MNREITLYTMSPSTGRWQIAGSVRAVSAKVAVADFQRLHPEQTVAAARAGSAHKVRP